MKLFFLAISLVFTFTAHCFELQCVHQSENPPVKDFTIEVKSFEHVLINSWEEARSPWGPVSGDMIFDGYFRTISGEWAGERITLTIPYALLTKKQSQAEIEYLVRDYEGWELYSTSYLCFIPRS